MIEELKHLSIRMGIVNVIDAFHIVAREETTSDLLLAQHQSF